MYYTAIPLHNELLSSWLIRSSILNGTDPIGYTGGIWLEKRIWTKDIDRHLTLEESQQLYKNSNLTLNQIRHMTLEPTYSTLINPTIINPKKQWEYIIPTGIRNRTKTNGLHFCSLCIKESIPYLKKHWRFSWNSICEKHHVLLQLKCPRCGNCFSPHLLVYTDTDFTKCQYCQASLIDKETISVNQSTLELQKFLNLSLNNKKVAPNNYPIIDQKIADLFATVRGLMLFFRDLIHTQSYCSYREYIFQQISYPYSPMKKEPISIQATIDALPVNYRYQLLDIISHLFQFTLSEIIAILQKSDISKQLFTRSIKLYSPTLILITSKLIDRPKEVRKKVSRAYQEYQPRSKEKVEHLMDEIRKYL